MSCGHGNAVGLENVGPRRRCLLVFGGCSDEHMMSIHTAATVWKYLVTSRRIELCALFVSSEGDLFAPPAESLEHLGNQLQVDSAHVMKFPCKLVADAVGRAYLVTADGTRIDFDIVFPLILGRSGEDGAVYGFFRFLGYNVVGPDADVSATLFDKVLSKEAFRRLGVTHVAAMEVSCSAGTPLGGDLALRVEEAVGFPCVVKPVSQGSSLGVSVCRTGEDLRECMGIALAYDRRVLVEPFIKAVEHCCYAWRANGQVEVSSVLAIRPKGNLYDFDQKYTPRQRVTFEYLDVGTPLSIQIVSQTRELYRSLRGRGIWRFDYFVDDAGHVIMNEINTVPAFVNVFGKKHQLNMLGLRFETVLESVILEAERSPLAG